MYGDRDWIDIWFSNTNKFQGACLIEYIYQTLCCFHTSQHSTFFTTNLITGKWNTILYDTTHCCHHNEEKYFMENYNNHLTRIIIILVKWLKYDKMHYANFQQCKICSALQEPTSSSGLSMNDCKHLLFFHYLFSPHETPAAFFLFSTFQSHQ